MTQFHSSMNSGFEWCVLTYWVDIVDNELSIINTDNVPANGDTIKR